MSNNRNLTMRVYQSADEPAVIALWERVFPDDPPWNKPPDLIRAKVAFQAEWFFVCFDDDRLVGTVLAGYDGVRGWVHKVAVHPDHQRRGIARLLMTTAEDALRGAGCKKLNLQVRADNEDAISFYRTAGYAEEERVSMGKKL